MIRQLVNGGRLDKFVTILTRGIPTLEEYSDIRPHVPHGALASTGLDILLGTPHPQPGPDTASSKPSGLRVYSLHPQYDCNTVQYTPNPSLYMVILSCNTPP